MVTQVPSWTYAVPWLGFGGGLCDFPFCHPPPCPSLDHTEFSLGEHPAGSTSAPRQLTREPDRAVLCLQATTHVYVTVVDENDNAPVFQQPHYEILLDEGPDTINTSLLTIQALDLDEGPNGTVTYTLVAGNIINTFRINRHMVAAGGVQEKGQLAKGIRGELSGMEGMEAEPRWSPGGSWGGSQCGSLES